MCVRSRRCLCWGWGNHAFRRLHVRWRCGGRAALLSAAWATRGGETLKQQLLTLFSCLNHCLLWLFSPKQLSFRSESVAFRRFALLSFSRVKSGNYHSGCFPIHRFLGTLFWKSGFKWLADIRDLIGVIITNHWPSENRTLFTLSTST